MFICVIGVPLRSLEQHNGNRIVQDALTKDDGVELWVDLVGIENGQNGDRVCGRERCAHRHGFDKGYVEPFQRYPCPQPEDDAQYKRRDESPSKSKCQDGADVAEEVGL